MRLPLRRRVLLAGGLSSGLAGAFVGVLAGTASPAPASTAAWTAPPLTALALLAAMVLLGLGISAAVAHGRG